MSNKAAPSIKYKLSDVQDEDLRSKLEHGYIAYENLKRIQVETLRKAQRATAEANRAMADVQLAEMDFLIDASDAFDLISTEPNWITRRNSEGQVILECLLTQKDIQDIQRTQMKHVKDHVKPIIDEEDGEDASGLFRDE